MPERYTIPETLLQTKPLYTSRRDSFWDFASHNPRNPPPNTKGQAQRLALSLFVVGTAGFEPTTPCTPCKCATGLRHVPKNTQPDPVSRAGEAPIYERLCSSRLSLSRNKAKVERKGPTQVENQSFTRSSIFWRKERTSWSCSRRLASLSVVALRCFFRACRAPSMVNFSSLRRRLIRKTTSTSFFV